VIEEDCHLINCKVWLHMTLQLLVNLEKSYWSLVLEFGSFLLHFWTRFCPLAKSIEFRPVPITANAIASRLVENSRYKKPDRQYSTSVHKAVN